jgi:hypothetical protein
MSFDKYTKKRVIPKVVDPSSNPAGANKATAPPEVQQAQEIKETSLDIVVNDLESSADLVMAEIQATIAAISDRNKSSAIFNNYAKMIKENYVAPEQLLVAGKPVPTYSPITIKLAERDVFRKVVDPRAPFFQDLHNMEFEAAAIKITTQEVWREILNGNHLYDQVEDNQTLRQVLGREGEYLGNLSARNLAIQRLAADPVSSKLIDILVNKILERLSFHNSIEMPSWYEDTIKTLKQIKLLLNLALFAQTRDWEKFGDNLYNKFNNQVNYLAHKLYTAQLYAINAGVHNKIAEFMDDLSIPEIGIGVEDIPEITAFFNKIQGVLGTNIGEIQEDLIERDGNVIKLEENRNLLLVSSKKSLDTKQYVTIVDGILAHLDGLKTTILSLNTSPEAFYDSEVVGLTEMLKNRVSEAVSKIEWNI